MPRIRVLLDACVLVPYQLADLLLHLAEAEMFEPLWTEDILTEVQHHLVRRSLTPRKAARRVHKMCSAFPNAMVSGHQHLTSSMTNHPKDRHIAAAAVRSGAAFILTANLRDFPPDTLEPFDIEAIHPDDFLQDQLDMAPTETVACLARQREAYARPQFSATEFYLGLEKTAPIFAKAAVAAEIAQAVWHPDEPIPLTVASDADALQSLFPNGEPTPTDPRGAAYLWWHALANRTEQHATLQSLTWHPPAWGDFENAAQMIAGHNMAPSIQRSPGDHSVVYVTFIPNVPHSVLASLDAPTPDVKILTLVRCPDGWWRTWGLGTRVPTSAEVRGRLTAPIPPAPHGNRGYWG